MPRIIIFHNPDCARCRKIARVHKVFDWFNRVAISTETPKVGPLRPGEIAVEDLGTGQVAQGAEAVRWICRQIPAYLPFRVLLRVPPIARHVDKEVRGCSGGACAVPADGRGRASGPHA